jgi:hypothetical protein
MYTILATETILQFVTTLYTGMHGRCQENKSFTLRQPGQPGQPGHYDSTVHKYLRIRSTSVGLQMGHCLESRGSIILSGGKATGARN